MVFKDNEHSLFCEGVHLLTRSEIVVRTRGEDSYTFPIHFSEGAAFSDLGKFGIYSERFMTKDGQISGEVSLQVSTNDSFVVFCPFQFAKPKQPPYFMIPGFLYGSNNLKYSEGKQPKFNYGGKVQAPDSSLWSIRSDRCSHPSIITIKDNRVFSVGVRELCGGAQVGQQDKWSHGFQYNGLFLDSSQPDRDILGFTLGYEYAPYRYSWEWDNPRTPGNDEYLWGGIENCKGKTLTTKTYYFADRAEDRTAYGKALRSYYYEFRDKVNKRSTREETITKIGTSLVTNAWHPDEKFFYLTDDVPDGAKGDIGWTGGMQIAWPLLVAGKKSGDQQFTETALEYINHLCATAFNDKANLLMEEWRDGQWHITGWWGTRKDCLDFGDSPLHSAYLNGQASYYLLKCFEFTDGQNQMWADIARKVIDTAVRGQNKKGAFPIFFDPETGDAVDYNGFQACWFLPGVILLTKITGEADYLKSAERAMEHYYGWHLNGELYGTPMDTHNAVDQEGNLAFLTACAEMHKLTGNDRYLEMGRAALDWEFSWKFAYNTAHSNEPLKSMNWSSQGGSITSTYITTIHQMGNLVAGDIYYLYIQLNDEYIADRLRDTCLWGLGTYNRFDNDFGFGKEGMATEQFFYTDGLCCPWWNPWDGGVWEADLPWAAACVLLDCASDIPDSFFE